MAPAILTVGAARADTTDLAVLCDLTLGPAVTAAGRAYRAETGIRIHVFATAPGLILPQLAHGVQNDIVVTRIALLDQAVPAGLLTAEARSGAWRNPLVIAEAAGAAGAPDSGMFAVSELVFASGIDGASFAARSGLPPERIASAIDTAEVAFLLLRGEARSGLLHLTDVRANPGLRVVRALEDPPPVTFAAAVTKLARRPNPAAFVRFLGTPRGAAVLSDSGLERET